MINTYEKGTKLRVNYRKVGYVEGSQHLKKCSLPGLFPFLDRSPVIRDLHQDELLTVVCAPIDFGWYVAMRVKGMDGLEGWAHPWPGLFNEEK